MYLYALWRLMKQMGCFVIKCSGVPYLIREFVQKDKVTILYFHEIEPLAFERHVNVIRTRYNIISLNDFLNIRDGISKDKLPAKALIITIDDGHQSNFYLLPVIKKYKLPITIFVCSGIIGTRRRYWWMSGWPAMDISRLKLLPTEDRLKELRQIEFEETREYTDRQAISNEELYEMTEFVDFQAHTIFHPILTMCDDQRANFEIAQCKVDLEEKYCLSIYSLSYPNGNYGPREIALAKKSGYHCALTTDNGFNTMQTDPFMLKRIFVDGNACAEELIVKASGMSLAALINFRNRQYK